MARERGPTPFEPVETPLAMLPRAFQRTATHQKSPAALQSGRPIAMQPIPVEQPPTLSY